MLGFYWNLPILIGERVLSVTYQDFKIKWRDKMHSFTVANVCGFILTFFGHVRQTKCYRVRYKNIERGREIQCRNKYSYCENVTPRVLARRWTACTRGYRDRVRQNILLSVACDYLKPMGLKRGWETETEWDRTYCFLSPVITCNSCLVGLWCWCWCHSPQLFLSFSLCFFNSMVASEGKRAVRLRPEHTVTSQQRKKKESFPVVVAHLLT